MRDLILQLLELKADQIDKAWVESVRKGWKAQVRKAQAYKVYKLKPSDYDPNDYSVAYAVIRREAEKAQKAFAPLFTFVERLRQDLLINKGMWSHGDEAASLDSMLFELKEKIIDLLDKAVEVLKDWRGRPTGYADMSNPAGGWQFRKEWMASAKDAQGVMNGICTALPDGAKEVDKIISGKLLRHLTKITTLAGGTVDFGGYEPEQVSLGNLQIVFADTPLTKKDRKKLEGGRHPRYREDFIKEFQTAKALLARRGLDFLWTGIAYIRPKTLAPENHLGIHFGVGATYHRKGDYVTVYANPHSGLDELVVHELGHRYYYKYLSAEDRANFNKWFGKVKATSEYGATVPSEDFAEVFAAYVKGKDLSRDQIDRFKIVLGRSRKTEAYVPLRDLIASLR